MSHDSAATPGAGHHNVPLGPRQYVAIGLFLTVVTVVELWISYSGMPHVPMVAMLIVLSALKFGTVVAFFMHLRFDNPLLTRFFIFGLTLATAILLALIALFWTDHSDTRRGSAFSAAPAIERTL
jgi:cytochrome c oxidase subunit IV